jgi:signal transduction histidine kinase/CheY-like chemotaxis protein
MSDHVTSRTYARALRVVAAAIAVVAVAKHLAGDFPHAQAAHDLLIVRSVAAGLALLIAALSSPRRSVLQLQRLAFALGVDITLLCLGAALVVPEQLWEQSVSLVGMMFGAAVFLPWSWRWQATLVGVTLAAATIAVVLLVPGGAIAGHIGARALVTLYGMGALSVVGANLADRARRQLAAAESSRMHEQRLDALGRFAGGIAHQFNNLLGGILTHVSLLRQDASMGPAATQLDEIGAAARRGRDLTEELMRFTRSDPVRVQPTDAGKVLHSVAALARALLPEGAKIHVHAAPGLPPLAGDIDHLVHACTQIVLNARDAMRGRPDPRLALTAALHTVAAGDAEWRDAAPGRYVRIAISDTGRGMDAATVARAFEPFFSTKPMHEATGLGLATLLRVIRAHSGAVRVESEPGRGTTIHLLLPLSTVPRATPVPTPAAPPSPPSAVAASGATILVVDDEAIVRSSLKRALTRFGYRVLEAGDGGSALATMQAADPPVDLVILDLVLPGGGAGIFELLKAVRPDVRVLISSGYSPDADAARGLADRVEGFLPKPYELGQLRTAVSQALSGKAA